MIIRCDDVFEQFGYAEFGRRLEMVTLRDLFFFYYHMYVIYVYSYIKEKERYLICIYLFFLICFFCVRRMGTLNPRSRVQ